MSYHVGVVACVPLRTHGNEVPAHESEQGEDSILEITSRHATLRRHMPREAQGWLDQVSSLFLPSLVFNHPSPSSPYLVANDLSLNS